MAGIDNPSGTVTRQQTPWATPAGWGAVVPGRRRRFRAGDCLYRQGQDGRPGFVIESGWVAIEVDTDDGGRCIADFLLPGDVLVAAPRARRCPDHSARCLTDVAVRIGSRRELMAFAEETGDLAGYFDHCTACRMFRTQDHLANVVTRDAYGRVAHLLYELYCRSTHDGGSGGGGEIACPLRLGHIGAITGLSTVHVSRTLGQLAARGVLALKSSRLTVVDRTRLEHAAGGFDATAADPVLVDPAGV